MKIKVLMDNISSGELAGEWGLSILIEYEGRKILLDTGASGAFAENAEKMGIDLAEVDFAVLSHAHYDHSDGMEAFLLLMTMHRFIFGKHVRKIATVMMMVS